MLKDRFDAAEGLGLLDELVRLTAPPAGEEEICREGLALAASALGAAGGLLLLRPRPDGPVAVAASWGKASEADAAGSAEEIVNSAESVRELDVNAGTPGKAILLLPGDTGAIGALVLLRPSRWNGAARGFTRSAARTLAASLRAVRIIGEYRQQGELLARRNVELEALGELAARLQNLGREEEMLQAALDLVLDRLGLKSGWIFWGEKSRGQLELAACSGVADEFVQRARTSGVGPCLCEDVFATGKLRFARNTTDCPRMPEIVSGPAPIPHACIPLKFERGIHGVMNIASRPGQIFSPEELHFLEIVGHQVCLAVDKARTMRAEMRRNAVARALTDLARSIGGSLDLERVLAAIGDYARELLAADRCSIFLGDGSGPLRLAYLSGPPMDGLTPGAPADFEALGSRAFPEALRRRHALVVEDALKDPRGNPDLARRWGIGSAILVPLLAHDRMEGVLQADRSAPSLWSRDEVELADALGRQAAVAIENAGLYREAREAVLRLQQAQYGMMKAERLAAVGTLASSLAHEVRNPLNSISLQLVLLSRRVARLGDAADPEIASLIENARREIDRLDGLVGEFLSLSTIDRIRLAEHDLRDLVRDILGLLVPVAQQKGVSLAEGVTEPVPRILLDREKIKQVLINLVRNAIEATPEGGSITVSTRLSGDSLVIDVTDTGVGIEPGLDVFDFFTTTKRGGTGLGLPIARRIVEAHGGHLTFESEPGVGTTFFVTFKTAESGGPCTEMEAAR